MTVSHCQKPIRIALTLLEVIVGMVLLAGVVVSLLIAAGEHERRLTLSRQRQDAIVVADQLLTAWSQRGAPIPIEIGPVLGKPNWRYRTQLVRSEELLMTQQSVVALTVERMDANGRIQSLAYVELIQ